MKKLSSTPLTILFLCTTALSAQRDLAAGFGASSLRLDVDAATSAAGNLGIQHLNGEFFVTTRGYPRHVNQHFVTAFDSSGNKLRSWIQPGFAQASGWGFRDGASDGVNMVFGYEFGIQIVDADGGTVTTWETQNGTAQVPTGLISGNVLEPEQAGIARALAYDRTGNGGNGSFWTGNFSSSTFEIDLAGDIIRTNLNAGEVSYGFGIDPVSDGTRMWINSAPNAGALAEYDLTTGILTGRVMENGQAGISVQGGLDIIPGRFARGPGASGYDILHLQQKGGNGADVAFIRRLHLDTEGEGIPPSPVTRLGFREPNLVGSAAAFPALPHSDLGLRSYTTESRLLRIGFDISGDPGDGMGTGGLNGTPAVIFGNVGVDAAVGIDAASNVLGIRELTHLQPLLTSPQAQTSVFSRGMVLTNDPLLSGINEWRVPLPSGVPLQAVDECLRVQGLWLDSDVGFLPLAMTNQLRFCRAPDSVFLEATFAEFIGSNTFNAVTSSGFFSVTNRSSDPIIGLIYSLGDGTNVAASTKALGEKFFRWDTDSPGMADIFEGGDSQMPGCRGTYRNGSEISTGLIFTHTPQQNSPACDPTAHQGWWGVPFLGGFFPGEYSELHFNFTPGTFANGAKFEFDCDTDGRLGSDAASMVGIVVEARFESGKRSTGVAVADPFDPNRTFVEL